VEFPTSDWYDYWTGQKIPQPKVAAPVDAAQPINPAEQPPLAIQVRPELATLPVFVRAGSILPIAPVVQSVYEKPEGPLALHIYANTANPDAPCQGKLYLDDGKSYAYQHGEYLRIKFTCQLTAHDLRLNIAAREGSYPAWWKEIRVDIFGWEPQQDSVRVNGNAESLHIDRSTSSIAFTIPDDGKGLTVELK
jgi:alpha-glucosidase